MKKLSASLSLCIFLLLSCTSSHVRNTLADVETFIMERPDSALIVLDSIDRSLLTTKRLKAHHALLHAMALDKNYIDVSDDSIARVAVDYFSKRGPAKYEARSLYYLGLAYYYQGEYNKAIVELTKAEEVAEGVDSLYLGFVKTLQADTYSKTYNVVEELDCLRSAYEINKHNDIDYYIHVSKLRLSQALYDLNFVEESLVLLSELLNTPEVDSNIKLISTQTYASILAVESNEFQRVLELYNSVIEDSVDTFMSERDYWSMTYALYKSGDKESAIDMMARLEDTTITAAYWQYLIYKDEYPELALSYLEEYVKYNDIEVCDVELSMSRPSYTINTLDLLSSRFPDCRFWLIIGSDNWLTFDRWRESERIIADYGVIVYPRPGSEIQLPIEKDNVEIVSAPMTDVSSTMLRRAISTGEPVDDLLPAPVIKYIKTNKLYQ